MQSVRPRALCRFYICILLAYSVIKSVSVSRRNDGEDCSHDRLRVFLEWVWANCYGVKGSFLHCLKYLAYCVEWQSRSMADGLWS